MASRYLPQATENNPREAASSPAGTHKVRYVRSFYNQSKTKTQKGLNTFALLEYLFLFVRFCHVFTTHVTCEAICLCGTQFSSCFVTAKTQVGNILEANDRDAVPCIAVS